MALTHLISWKNIAFLAILLLTFSPSFLQGNASTKPAHYDSFSKTTSVSASNSILTLQRRINNTQIEVNQSTIVELILTNIGVNPIYNINLTETRLSNPLIITNNLISPLLFAKFESNETRIISYAISSLKATNITLSPAVATFQLSNDPNSPTYSAYSITSYITVTDKSVSYKQENL